MARIRHCILAPGLNLSFEFETLDMECFESLDDTKKKMSADLSSKNPTILGDSFYVFN